MTRAAEVALPESGSLRWLLDAVATVSNSGALPFVRVRYRQAAVRMSAVGVHAESADPTSARYWCVPVHRHSARWQLSRLQREEEGSASARCASSFGKLRPV